MQVVDIIIAVASGVLSLVVALFMRRIAQRDRRAEERQAQLIHTRACEMDYLSSVGTMAHRTAGAVLRAKIANGEVQNAMEDYAEKKDELLRCYNQQIAQDAARNN